MILNRIEGKPEEGMHGSSVSLQDSTRGSVKTIFLVIEKKGVEFDEGQKKCADTEAIETHGVIRARIGGICVREPSCCVGVSCLCAFSMNRDGTALASSS